MIKRYAINKFAISTLCLILIGLFYFVPIKKELKEDIIVESNLQKQKVYLLDEDNYVSQVTTYFTEDNIENNIKKRIDILTNGINDLSLFYPLIPKKTKVNSIKVEKNNVYIDFDEELLVVNKYIKEYMVEAIIYTLTEINGIDNVYLYVNGKDIDGIQNPLNRNYGINKEYNINSFNNIKKTTVFFSKKNNDVEYYVPITKISNSNSEKIDIIIYELKNSINSQNNLNSYINDNLKLVSYNIDDNKMNLVFNNYIFMNNKILEEVQYVISNSIFENYDVNEIIFNTEDFLKVISITKNH